MQEQERYTPEETSVLAWQDIDATLMSSERHECFVCKRRSYGRRKNEAPTGWLRLDFSGSDRYLPVCHRCGYVVNNSTALAVPAL